MRILKLFTLLILVIIANSPNAIADTAVCYQKRDVCLADCQAFNNPLTTWCGCMGGFGGLGQTCNWCCQNQWNHCVYCATYGSGAGDPRCQGCL